jgi:hypothetical protein
MGQRSQIVVITPQVYYNQDNPNNSVGGLFISHNQWRYGRNAIIVLADFIKKYQAMLDNQTDKEFFKKTVDSLLDDCVRYAENHRIGWTMSPSHSFKEFTEFLTNSKGLPQNFLEETTDNNNGWFAIKIDEKLNISFGILNGLEDDDTIRVRTPEQYISLFKEVCEDKDYQKQVLESLEYLNTFKQINPLKEISELRKKLGSGLKIQERLKE